MGKDMEAMEIVEAYSDGKTLFVSEAIDKIEELRLSSDEMHLFSVRLMVGFAYFAYWHNVYFDRIERISFVA